MRDAFAKRGESRFDFWRFAKYHVLRHFDALRYRVAANGQGRIPIRPSCLVIL